MVDNTLLGRIKIPDQAIYAVIFLVLFFIGIMGGRSIGMATITRRLHQTDKLTRPIPKIGNGQWNLLIIAVDQIVSFHPSLMGIWLLITSPENQNLILVPIYPAGDLNSVPENTDWEKVFSLNSGYKPNVDFLEKISEQIRWDDYLLIDKEGMTFIIEKLVNNNFVPQAYEAQVNKNVLQKPEVDIDISLNRQVEIWKAFCLKLSYFIEPTDLANFINQIEPHMQAQFELNDVIHQRNLLDETELQLTCEFPTLTLNSHEEGK